MTACPLPFDGRPRMDSIFKESIRPRLEVKIPKHLLHILFSFLSIGILSYVPLSF